MVVLFVGGNKIGTLADAERLIPHYASTNSPIEFREDSGEVLGTFLPKIPRPPEPAEPLIPWDPTITKEDIERIVAEPGFTFEEVRKKLGWA